MGPGEYELKIRVRVKSLNTASSLEPSYVKNNKKNVSYRADQIQSDIKY